MPVTCYLAVSRDQCRAIIVGDIGPGDIDVVVRRLCDAVDESGCRRLTVDLSTALVLEPSALTTLARIKEHAIQKDVLMHCVGVRPWLRGALIAANLADHCSCGWPPR